MSGKTYCWHVATRGRYKGQPVKCRSNPCSLHSDAEHIKAGTRDARGRAHPFAIGDDRTDAGEVHADSYHHVHAASAHGGRHARTVSAAHRPCDAQRRRRSRA